MTINFGRRRPAPSAPTSDGAPTLRKRRPGLVAMLIVINILLALWYFTWLLSPAHAGEPWVYGILVGAELFNLVQAAGFWWTVRSESDVVPTALVPSTSPRVDVLIPTYNEPVDIVEPTVMAAIRMKGAVVRVWLLDDGDRPEMAELASRHGIGYFARPDHAGAKAGNLNHALRLTDAPLIAVFDCDHTPAREFLVETTGHFADDRVAFVQTPQYYINRDADAVSAAAASQQDLFFGVIARGKSTNGAMFCCGTNFVLRRQALDELGGFQEDTLTEDFELSIRLHERGWTSVYVPNVLAHGLGPEDMSSYVSQQARWAQGCLSSLPRIVRSDLPFRVRAQYLLACMYFLSGWTVLVYMSLPVIRIFGHVGPIHSGSASQFLAHFVPYFASCMLTLAVASEGSYTFGAYSLAVANFGVQVHATLRAILRRRGRFVVTPKHAVDGRHWRSVLPALAAMVVLSVTVVVGLATDPSASSLTNAAFASIWLALLISGTWSALVVYRPAPVAATRSTRPPGEPVQPSEVALDEFVANISAAVRHQSSVNGSVHHSVIG